MNNKETISYIKSAARVVNLTFKENKQMTINNCKSYMFIVRGGGDVVMANCTLSSAFENTCSGYITSWDGEQFKGVD